MAQLILPFELYSAGASGAKVMEPGKITSGKVSYFHTRNWRPFEDENVDQ
jgi:hypothetical protein